jgi:ABC-type uncharacterized transport system involved in gliding motility auxiliary subunit
MKLKIMYPLAVILLFLLVAFLVLGIYCVKEKYTTVAIIAFVISGLSLIGCLTFSYFIYIKSKQAVGNVAVTMFRSWLIFIFIVLNLFIFIFVANKLYFRLDMTEGQKYSISKPTIDLIHKINNSMIIEYYYNDKCKEQPTQAQVVQYVIDILTEYENASRGMIDFRPEELNYARDRAKFDELSQKGMREFPLTQSREDESKVSRGLSGIIIKYKDKEKVLPVINQDVGFEYAIDIEIKKMIGEMGSLGIIFGVADQTFDNDYSNINVIASNDNIPENISTLAIIGGSNLTDYDIFKIDQFLLRGGKAIILENGVNVIINPQYGIFAFPNENKLINMLSHYGITINKDIIGDNESYTPFPSRDAQGFGIEYRYPIWPRIKKENMSQTNSALQDIKTLNFFWPSSIDISDSIKNNIEVLIHTTKDSWTLKDNFKIEPNAYEFPVQKGIKEYNIGVVYNGKITSYFKDKDAPEIEKTEADGKIKKIKYTGKKIDSGESQIVVISNIEFMQDMFFQAYLSSQNEMFLFRNLIDTISNDQALIKIRSKGQFSRPLDKPKNRGQYDINKQIIITITTFILPVILILLGVAIYILRQARNKRLRYLFNKKES